jgi:hypothetical protein
MHVTTVHIGPARRAASLLSTVTATDSVVISGRSAKIAKE